MTDTPHRRRLVPKAAIVAAVVITLVVAGAVAATYLVARSRLAAVPDVVGLPAEVAEETIEAEGFAYELAGTRVSVDVPNGQVISQEPGAGAMLEPGATVAVIVSVGPQTFVVPDLVGSSVDGARDALEALGLSVVTEAVSSDTTAGIVLEMYPAPGAAVSPGDEIRLSVPGGSGEADALLPYDLRGATVLIDPLPPATTDAGDAAMEVTRRLQALLEAAGATVTTTASTSGAGASVDTRAATAVASAADVFIGVDVGSTGIPGLHVEHLRPGGDAYRVAVSEEYARAITRAATLPNLVVSEPLPSDDAVLLAFKGPGVRVIVGDQSIEADTSRFSDPAWADQVARAIYRGVGTTLEGD